MLAFGFVLGFAMFFTNLFKKYIKAEIATFFVPMLTLVLACIFNVVNALIFGDGSVTVLIAIKEAITVTAPLVGLFVTGDKLRQSDSTPFKTERD